MQKFDNEYYLNGIKARDNEVLTSIYKEFLGAVTSFVIKNKGQQEDAKDIFNKVIYQFTARLERDTIEINSKFEAYLFTACKNMWRRELMKMERSRVTNSNIKELYYDESDLTMATLEQERWELFNQKVLELSENCNKILTLFFQKLSSKEIMIQLEYGSEVTVRQRIFKCKTKLAELIKGDNRYNELMSN
ncbi:MAG: sigma-70 family RNA polymerase sigma factor [Chitinophagales bacterium]